MDLQTMRTFVLTHEDLEAEDLEETLLDGWANEAYTRIIRLVATYPFLDSSVSLDTVAGTSAYDHGLRRVEVIYGDSGLLEWIGHSEAQRKYLLNRSTCGRNLTPCTRCSSRASGSRPLGRLSRAPLVPSLTCPRTSTV